jgi:hypothetical protein
LENKMKIRTHVALAVMLPFAALGCEGDSPTGSGISGLVGDAELGALVFEAECASCHSSKDGFDLAAFSFTDTTIIRRALGHVDMDAARDIVAHVNRLPVRDRRTRESSPFQPGDRVLGSDYDFAINTFGMDAWPADLTTYDLRNIDVTRTEVAIDFPQWSVEANNRDWMPDVPVPDHLLDYRDGRARDAIDKLYRDRSISSLLRAVDALSDGDKDRNNPDAPCIMDPIEDLRARECFEARRWAASLGAQYMLRYGIDAPIHHDVHDVWWDAGFVARRTVVNSAVRGDIQNGVDNWVSWMWMGWAFEPNAHSSVYLSQGLERKGLFRHATFHILKAQVERGRNSTTVYFDLRHVPRFAPDTWLVNALEFSFQDVLERLEAGERPTTPERVEMAIDETERAYRDAARRLTPAQAAHFAELRDAVLEYLR